MKSFNKVLMMAGIVVCIVAFWLAPLVNTAKPATYVRLYEDVDPDPGKKREEKREERKMAREINKAAKQVKKDSKYEYVLAPDKHGNKRYKKERIHSRNRLRGINAKMYSRGAQFLEEVPDTVVQEIKKDTTQAL